MSCTHEKLRINYWNSDGRERGLGSLVSPNSGALIRVIEAPELLSQIGSFMPEDSPDAAILRTISWQGLGRPIRGNKQSELADRTMLMLIAGFLVEAKINCMIDEMNRTAELQKFPGRQYPGLQDKFGWYCNKYVARKKANSRKQLRKIGIR